MNEQRSIQRLQMAMTVFQAYSNNIQNAKVGENPFTKTLTDITLLNQVINSLPTFIDGTETNIASALGKPHLQGQDGYIVRVDGSEKVLNPQLSAMTGNMTTMEIAKLAEDFRRGDIMRKGEGAMQLNVGSWGTDMIISELQDLKNVIKNKPENQVEVAEILNGVISGVITGFNAIKGYFDAFINLIKTIWDKFGKDITSGTSRTFTTLKDTVKNLLTILIGFVKLATGLISGDFNLMGKSILNIFTSLFNFFNVFIHF
jgi:hypothetical protein